MSASATAARPRPGPGAGRGAAMVPQPEVGRGVAAPGAGVTAASRCAGFSKLELRLGPGPRAPLGPLCQ